MDSDPALAEGYEAVINLAPHDSFNNALEDEPGIVAALGLDYHHIPIDWEKPEPRHYTEFCTAVNDVGDKKVLVHCAANFRVSAMVSSYALNELGWSLEDADALLNRIWSSNPDYPMNDTWQAFIDAVRQG